MKIVIAGSRTLSSWLLVDAAISISGWRDQITQVVSGTARGVDQSGEIWAERNSIPVIKFPADWDLYQNAAGPIRNEKMGDYADAGIILWDMKSTGAKHMYGYLQKIKKPVTLVPVRILTNGKYQINTGGIFDPDT